MRALRAADKLSSRMATSEPGGALSASDDGASAPLVDASLDLSGDDGLGTDGAVRRNPKWRSQRGDRHDVPRSAQVSLSAPVAQERRGQAAAEQDHRRRLGDRLRVEAHVATPVAGRAKADQSRNVRAGSGESAASRR